MQNISLIESKNNNNEELNNKLALECSYLINEIKRKNSALFLPIFITNKKIYLKDKLLSSKKYYFNVKNKNNIKKLIARNIQKKYYNKNLSEDNIIQKKIKKTKKNNNINLASLYNLPKLKQKYLNKSQSTIIDHKNYLYNYNPKSQEVEIIDGKSKKNSNFLGIENFMKEKFYADTENKLKNKIQTKYFRNDELIKQKIIFMKKFGIFWRGFIQYCTPIIKLKKYQLDFAFKKKKNGNEFDYNEKINKKRYLNINYENNKGAETNKLYYLPKID